MAGAAFNVISVARRLRDAGFEDKEAEAITQALDEGIAGGVATKRDVEVTGANIKFELTWLLLGGVAGLLALFSGINMAVLSMILQSFR